MKKQYQSNEWGQGFRTASNLSTTPRGSSKHNIPIDLSRRSTTPSKIQERVSNSPLRVPLDNAINKAAKPREMDLQRSGVNRYMAKSSRRDQSPMRSMAKKIYYDEDPQTVQMKIHPQTQSFVKKYFQTINLQVPLQRLIQKIMQQYETLWGTQNADKIFDDFNYKMADIFGYDYVDLRQLVRITKDDGMIGLILRIFKQIKNQQNTRCSNYASFSQNPQFVNLSRSFQQRLAENQTTNGLKNVIQEFMQSMYQTMENQIYQKFNIQMRRMIIKYRQAQKILKKVNQKINSYADVFDFDKKYKQREKKLESIIQEITKQKQKAVIDLEKQKEILTNERREKDKLLQQIAKLKQTLQKYQNIVLTKAMQSNSEVNLIRQTSAQSRISQRPPLQPMKTSQIKNCQPFKITIDTHVVHKQNIPQTKTFTTFHNGVPAGINPPRESYDSRTVQYKTNTPFSTSRITTIRPLSPSPLSPYQSRVSNRPL